MSGDAQAISDPRGEGSSCGAMRIPGRRETHIARRKRTRDTTPCGEGKRPGPTGVSGHCDLLFAARDAGAPEIGAVPPRHGPPGAAAIGFPSNRRVACWFRCRGRPVDAWRRRRSLPRGGPPRPATPGGMSGDYVGRGGPRDYPAPQDRTWSERPRRFPAPRHGARHSGTATETRRGAAAASREMRRSRSRARHP